MKQDGEVEGRLYLILALSDTTHALTQVNSTYKMESRRGDHILFRRLVDIDSFHYPQRKKKEEEEEEQEEEEEKTKEEEEGSRRRGK